MGLIADEQPATAHVLQTARLTHGKGMQSYLTMMVIVFFAAIAMIACGPSVMPLESESNANPSNQEQSGTVLLLDEESAISILQTYLQECVLGWDESHARRTDRQRTEAISAVRRANSYTQMIEKTGYMGRKVSQTSTPRPFPTPLPPDLLRLPASKQEKQSWLMGLATGTVGAFAWSASYHGVTEVPELYVYNRGFGPSRSETWVVIGPGFDGSDNTEVVPGRWKVYAGFEQVDYVDAPARLAIEEYDSYNSCP